MNEVAIDFSKVHQIQVFGITILEPSTVISSLMMTVICIYAFVHLGKLGRAHRMYKQIQYFFFFMGIAASGAPMYAVMIFQTILVLFTAFEHANISLPKKLDAAISWLFVSPNMHKVHHHWKQPYTDSNYGAILSIWDRALGTFMHLDHKEIRYGLDRYYPNEKDEDFMHLLKSPFGKME